MEDEDENGDSECSLEPEVICQLLHHSKFQESP